MHLSAKSKAACACLEEKELLASRFKRLTSKAKKSATAKIDSYTMLQNRHAEKKIRALRDKGVIFRREDVLKVRIWEKNNI